MPESVISKLEDLWPDVKLSVTNNRKRGKHSDRPMDVRLLSSPLLYSLDYSIFQCMTSANELCSESRQLKDILVQSPNLQVLSLAVYPRFADADVPKLPKDSHRNQLPVCHKDDLTAIDTIVSSRVLQTLILETKTPLSEIPLLMEQILILWLPRP
jgi:hypothetical protein